MLGRFFFLNGFDDKNTLSLTECTVASPPAPLRMARGVICEVTPIGLLTYFVKVFLSQSTQSSLSIFAHSFEPTERLRHTEFTEASPPAPLRMERGVVCEVTPTGLLIEGEGLLNIRRTCRGISVITPLSIRRGAGGEASVEC